MADGFVPYAESFYETTLANAIGASDSSIAVTTAPAKTEGYLVIEYNSSNREIIKYTGVSGTTLTGCVRGLSISSNTDSAGTGTTHPAGASIACKDVHYYLNNVIGVFRGDDASGFNTWKMGDGAAVSSANRLWYAITSSVSSFWGLSSNGKMVVSEDGITSYVISAGGSGVAAGAGIDITAGVVTTANLSTGGIGTSASKNVVALSGSLINRNSTGIYYDPSQPVTFTSSMDFTGDFRVNSWKLSAGISAINQALNGISSSVTAANLGTLTNASSEGSSLHYHDGGKNATAAQSYFSDLAIQFNNATTGTATATGVSSNWYATNAATAGAIGAAYSYVNPLAGDGLSSSSDITVCYRAIFSVGGHTEAFCAAGLSGVASVPTSATDIGDHAKFIYSKSAASLSCSTGDGATQTKTPISGYNVSAFHDFKIEFLTASCVNFYIDGNAVATHTTNIPNSGALFPIFGAASTTADGASGTVTRILPKLSWISIGK